ncbi:MAG: type II secretion system protein [Verrucomicrobia bacterium]|nr:type II secretion system protein [Verrucomicrobiota bacterium]
MRMMTSNKGQLGCGWRAFTLIELLMVISIIGIIASLTVVGLAAARGKKEEAAIKTQLAKLVLAIESYKKQYGAYPPDNPIMASNNPAWNPLAYELGGVRRSGANFTSELDPAHTIRTAGPNEVNHYFAVAGFVNVTPPSGKARSFITGGGSGENATFVYVTNAVSGIANAAMFLRVPAEHPMGVTNVWRYRAYPVNGRNPKSFDLWAEFKRRGGGTNIIGNWN